MAGTPESDRVLPLEPRDPPALGDVRLLGRLDTTDAGIVYAGEAGDERVVVVMMTEGAAADSYARARFTDSLAGLDGEHDDQVVSSEVDPEVAPWAALRATDWEQGVTVSQVLLAPVTLEHVPALEPARGPDFRPHWFRRDGAGRWRMWPLPWPSSLTTAGRWTYVASFALVLAIAAVALFIAVKLFEDQGPAPVPPPFPRPTPSSPTPPPSPEPTPTPTRPSQSRPPGPTPTDHGPTAPTPAPPII